MANGLAHIPSYDMWMELPQETRDFEMFCLMKNISERLAIAESKTWWNRTTNFVGGIIGGFIAIIACWLFER